MNVLGEGEGNKFFDPNSSRKIMYHNSLVPQILDLGSVKCHCVSFFRDPVSHN